MMAHVTWDRGVHLPEQGLWLDPGVVKSLAFVSHAHQDHVRRHERALLTPTTWRLVPPARRPRSALLLETGGSTRLGGATVTLSPAGHMAGSALALIEHDGARLLYTGDLRLRAPEGRTAIPAADVLVVESTYGRPHFLFPEPAEVVEGIARWCRLALAAGVTPVLLGHALGKAQELMVRLAPYGFTFALDARCMPYADAHREMGLSLPDYVALDEDVEPGRVVIAPPAGRASVRRLARRHRVAMVSGWALEETFWRRTGAEIAFPLSDHCDFQDLVEVCRLSGASRVYTVHGFAEDLARHLRKRGVRACALAAAEQLDLGLA